jgi:UDP-2-acetamido-3-amino-2,3-dideoxy-glucuronate N-acetyltransferase
MNGCFIHPQALCESTKIGSETRIWAFSHILPGAVIGADCNICDHVFIENDVVIGDRVTVKCGVQLWDGLRIGNDVFIGPNATFTNDKHPRSKHYQSQVLQTHLEAGASIGANATILPNIRIGAKAMVGAGSVVTRDVPSRAIVAGNPARIIGYTDVLKHEETPTQTSFNPSTSELRVRGASLHHIKTVEDLRGSLSVAEFGDQIPFLPRRYFIVRDVPSQHVRGEHAHRACEQFLICTNGSLSVVVDDGWQREELVLDTPAKGLYIPPMVWGAQYKYTLDAVLLVFASHLYDSADYIRNYDEFLTAINLTVPQDRQREAA